MPNIPGIMYSTPGVGYATPIEPEPQDYIFEHNGTTLNIKIDGDIIIDGNARDAAKALFNHVLDLIEYSNNNDTFKYSLILNKVRLSLKKPITIIYPYQKGMDIPENFFSLKIEFDKLVKLMVFL